MHGGRALGTTALVGLGLLTTGCTSSVWAYPARTPPISISPSTGCPHSLGPAADVGNAHGLGGPVRGGAERGGRARAPTRGRWVQMVAVAAVLLPVLVGCASPATMPSAAPGYVAAAPQIRLDPAAACPPSSGRNQDVRNAGDRNTSTGLTQRMVPREDPRGALICVFRRPTTGPTLGDGPHLHRQVRLDAHGASVLSRDLARVALGLIRATYSCPGAPGSVVVIAFAYARHASVDLWYDDSGCQRLDNGYVIAVGVSNPSFSEHFVHHVVAWLR